MHILSARFYLAFIIRGESLNFLLFQQAMWKMGKMFVSILLKNYIPSKYFYEVLYCIVAVELLA